MDTPGPDKPFSDIQKAGERDVSPPPPYSEHTHFDTTSIQPGGQGVSALDSVPKDPPPPYDGSADGDAVTSAYAEQEYLPAVMTNQPQSYQRHTQTSAGINSSTQLQDCCNCTDCDDFCSLCMCMCCLCDIFDA